ncbi:MAG TPA: Sapep family Mn(2+)-dependent dipeptidase, partial [Bacillota bacterium]|nr:Sapep family Mn(2+)-dependent dipeptidase [Bacillota bacterium]
DADFPLIQCEKGLLEFEITKKNEGSEAGKTAAPETGGLFLESLTGGSAANVVASQAVIRILGTPGLLVETEAQIKQKAAGKEYETKTAIAGERLTVTVTGRPAHAAYPERGRNAISMAMDLLGDAAFSNEDANRLVKFYNDKIGFALDGSKIGCAMEDDLSGRLTFNVGKIDFDAGSSDGSGNLGGVAITVDIRYPATKSKEEVWQAMKPAVLGAGFSMEELDHIHSIYQESDNPVVKTLLEVYRRISGDTESQPTAIGGATFARAIPNCMAFGPLFPGDPELEHQKNEAAKLSQMLRAGEIYAEAVYRLTGGENA